MADPRDVVAQVPLFQGFSKGDMKLLMGALKEDWFNAGDEIIAADDEGARFYVITEGRAKITVEGEVVRTVGPGDYFGEMALIDDSPRSASVVAETQIKCLWLSRLNFLSMLEENWSMTKIVLADLCSRLRRYDRAQHHTQ